MGIYLYILLSGFGIIIPIYTNSFHFPKSSKIQGKIPKMKEYLSQIESLIIILQSEMKSFHRNSVRIFHQN